MVERDSRLSTATADRLAAGPAGAALVTATGRVIAGDAERLDGRRGRA